MRKIKNNKKTTNNKKRITLLSKEKSIKNWIFWFAVIIVCIILIIAIPIIINESYKMNKGYITLWDASDVLSYYAVILSGIITIVALIVTICFTSKDTEKQLNFYKSQVNTPFFTIGHVFHIGATPFYHSDTNVWKKQIEMDGNRNINENEKTEIEIVLINNGQGVALDPSYEIDMFADSFMFNHIINKDDQISIIYDFNKNLNDKWVKSYLSRNSLTEKCTFYTYINVFYKNTMGISFQQKITIEFNINLITKKLDLCILPISSQKIIDNY